MIWLLLLSFVCALVPALVFRKNSAYFQPPLKSEQDDIPRISVLIPARNEELSIQASVQSVLASQGIELECFVLDDHSTDRTREIVQELSLQDPRVQVVTAPPLPADWSGKQHACYILSQHARYPVLTFLDADVRLQPDALARMHGFLKSSGSSLVSGFPRQITITWMECLVIPLMHFVLLGFLPLWRMRQELSPAYGAGCGQWFMTTREAYQKVYGHRAIKQSFHDGIQLPRIYRAHGEMTDLCDVTSLAQCRMYHSARSVWNGLAKNATEGIAKPFLLPVATILLLLGQVLPFLAGSFGIVWLVLNHQDMQNGYMALLYCVIIILTMLLAWYPRWFAAVQFQQSKWGAVLHPLGILIFLAIQWYALVRKLIGRPIAWKGRAQPASATGPDLPQDRPSS